MSKSFVIHYTAPNKVNLEYLESLNMTYREMIECFDIHMSKQYISKLFKEFGLHHKTTIERVISSLEENPSLIDKSNSSLANYFRCNRKTVSLAKEKIKNDSSNNNKE